MEWKKLSTDEERVILGKGTEAPFSGEYENLRALTSEEVPL